MEEKNRMPGESTEIPGGIGAAWDEKAAGWISGRRVPEDVFARRSRWVASAAARGAPGPLFLDIGCGDGTLLGMMHDAGFDVYGCDISRKMVDAAAEYLSSRLPGARDRVRRNTADSLPFGNMKFDVISAIGVLPYLEDWAPFMKLVHGSLRPGGRFVASWANPASFFALCEALKIFLRNPKDALAGRGGAAGQIANLLKTGLWSGGHVARNPRTQPRSRRGFAALAESSGFVSEGRICWHNIRFLDGRFDSREEAGHPLASRLAWTQIEVLSRR